VTRHFQPAILLAAIALLASGCLQEHAEYSRELSREFRVAPASTVAVSVGGGPVHATAGAPGVVRVRLREEIHADSSDEAERILQEYDVDLAQQGSLISVGARRKPGIGQRFGWSRNVSFSVTLEAPPDVDLDLRTSGGSIQVRGERTANLQARTSGGSVSVDGGPGQVTVQTSGGSISVGRLLGTLRASTSGGSIRVGYVGAHASDVALNTSGGSIRAGLDPAATLDVVATTSGGGVDVFDLPIETSTRSRSQVVARLNGGGGQFRAHTSGGSIRLSAAGPSESAMLAGAR
jgi:hypothetical protein